MSDNRADSWWSRHLWKIVLFPCLGAILLAGVSVFKGWLHMGAGFDSEGRPLNEVRADPPEPKKDPPAPKPRARVAAVAAYQRIAADLNCKDDEIRPRLRYLTLLHRHNEPACTDAELEADRQAVRDLMALLAPRKSAHIDAIDPDQLIFRINLDDLGWTAETDWHRLVSQYRYAGAADEPLAKLRTQVADLTQEPIAVVRADWFVVALTRPPLTGPDGLLRTTDLPESIRALVRQYSAQTLNLAGCVRELDQDDDKAIADLIRKRENLQQEFALAPLLKGERIRRDWWESDRNHFSPYQELARLLKQGNPIRVQ